MRNKTNIRFAAGCLLCMAALIAGGRNTAATQAPPAPIGQLSVATADDTTSPAARPTEGIRVALTLDEAIRKAQTQSIAAIVAKYTFLSSYWQFRSYKASRLPSLELSGELLSFDRSLRLLQDYDTGEMRYRSNYNLQNTMGLSIRQNIGLTGGTLSLYSSLNRLDQFAPDKSKSYYSQPVTLAYTQPLFAYNRLKWDKQIAPREYELAKRQYIESMEQITRQAVTRYFQLVLSRMRQSIAEANYRNTRSLYSIAENRLKLGSITNDELLQLELRMLNDSLAINTSALSVREELMQFNSYLRLPEHTDVDPRLDEHVPVLHIDYAMAMDKVMANSSFNLSNEIRTLNAEASVAKAKSERGASATINARFGLSQTGDRFRTVYSGLMDQEIVGLQFSVPIFDWGMGKGRVRMAKAHAEMVRSQIEQETIDFRRSVYMLIEQLHNQRNQCEVARLAHEVADRRYRIAMENFRTGTVSVTEMNTAQSERDAATQTYVCALATFWEYYYSLRGMALYDFITGTDISAEFDQIIEQQSDL